MIQRRWVFRAVPVAAFTSAPRWRPARGHGQEPPEVSTREADDYGWTAAGPPGPDRQAHRTGGLVTPRPFAPLAVRPQGHSVSG